MGATMYTYTCMMLVCLGVCVSERASSFMYVNISNNIPHNDITSPFYNGIVYQGYISLMMIEICVFGYETFWAVASTSRLFFNMKFVFVSVSVSICICICMSLSFIAIYAVLVYVWMRAWPYLLVFYFEFPLLPATICFLFFYSFFVFLVWIVLLLLLREAKVHAVCSILSADNVL